jgi:hypothetical protein
MRYYIWDKQAGGLVRNTAPQSFDSFEDARRHIERSPREEWPRFSVFPDPSTFPDPGAAWSRLEFGHRPLLRPSASWWGKTKALEQSGDTKALLEHMIRLSEAHQDFKTAAELRAQLRPEPTTVDTEPVYAPEAVKPKRRLRKKPAPSTHQQKVDQRGRSSGLGVRSNGPRAPGGDSTRLAGVRRPRSVVCDAISNGPPSSVT